MKSDKFFDMDLEPEEIKTHAQSLKGFHRQEMSQPSFILVVALVVVSLLVGFVIGMMVGSAQKQEAQSPHKHFALPEGHPEISTKE